MVVNQIMHSTISMCGMLTYVAILAHKCYVIIGTYYS